MWQVDTDGAGGPDQQSVMHYSDRWQLLEEDVWDDWSEQTPGDIDRHVQHVPHRCGDVGSADHSLGSVKRACIHKPPGQDVREKTMGSVVRSFL